MRKRSAWFSMKRSSTFAAEKITELASARKRRLRRRGDAVLDSSLLERGDAALGRATLGRHLCTQQRRLGSALFAQPDRALKRRQRKTSCFGVAKAEPASRVFKRLQKVENVGRTAAGDSRNRIQVAFTLAPQRAADRFQH